MPPRLKHELFLYYSIIIRFLVQKINYFFDKIIGTTDCAFFFIVISMFNHSSMNQIMEFFKCLILHTFAELVVQQ